MEYGAAPQHSVFSILFDRIRDAQGLQQLELYLSNLKSSLGLAREAVRATGSFEDLKAGAAWLHSNNFLKLADLAAFVDELEENGQQHIVFYRLTEAGRRAFSQPRDPFHGVPLAPTSPTLSYYAAKPARAILTSRPAEGLFTLRLVKTDEYWEIDPARSFESRAEKVTYWSRGSRRAVHLFRLSAATGIAEIRLARVSKDAPPSLWKEQLADLLRRLAPHIQVPQHLEPLPLWEAFGRMVRCRDGTFMRFDEARSPEIFHLISSTRAGTTGIDIRDVQQFDMDSDDYFRDVLNMYWAPNGGEDAARANNAPSVSGWTHTYLTKESFSGAKVAKAYISRRLTKGELDHVIGRILGFVQGVA